MPTVHFNVATLKGRLYTIMLGGEEERAEVRGVRDTREERETDGELWRD